MKTTRKFSGSRFLVAIVAAIIVGEVIAWEVANLYGIRAEPITVAFLCAGLVAAIACVLFEGADIE